MTTSAIAGGQILGPDGPEHRTVTIQGDTIESVTDREGPPHPNAIDGGDLLVAPGFIDLQINGGFGIDLQSDPNAMWDLGRLLPRRGVSAFLPTIITSPPATTDAALAAIQRRPWDYLGAEPPSCLTEGT